jgi:hypothetical protein
VAEHYSFGVVCVMLNSYLMEYYTGSTAVESIMRGTLVGLPIAATWPVSVPFIALITMANSGSSH